MILGICNGFQALVKSGLFPYGEIRDLDERRQLTQMQTEDTFQMVDVKKSSMMILLG